MTVHFGLGAANYNGPPIASGLALTNMVPGACCYDPDRPWYLPRWIASLTEKRCLEQTGGCTNQTTLTYVPPTPALPCQSAAGGVCQQGPPPINDNTGIDLSKGQPTDQAKLDAAAQAARDSATGLTAGGCPPGFDGTYPDCGTCSWYQTGTYPACDSSVSFTTLAFLAIGGFLIVSFMGRKR